MPLLIAFAAAAIAFATISWRCRRCADISRRGARRVSGAFSA